MRDLGSRQSLGEMEKEESGEGKKILVLWFVVRLICLEKIKEQFGSGSPSLRGREHKQVLFPQLSKPCCGNE